ncbi:sulfatase-like hydrolase/transferase [uncultured Paludibaculum sp.]|uniref:sulfatase-like hydrolase/transferase n=1 Tax=uncultured Paludibaculum sp. TaxID=1765020 RepID=UPI002AAACF93|nr:sulfatase-like hydrolase/transferase [uncultured Paludibaculum sp.]
MPTPNPRKFAEGGVLFRRAFSAAPTCSPSWAALLTGQTAHGRRMVGLAHRGFRLADPKRHLASFLQSQGYLTALRNVQHEAPAEEIAGLGYSEILRPPKNTGPEAARKAVEFLNTAPKQAFFLSCGFLETHREYPVAGPKEDPRYMQPPAILPDVPQVRQDMANFKAAARVLDDSMGAVFQALARNGLEENTLERGHPHGSLANSADSALVSSRPMVWQRGGEPVNCLPMEPEGHWQSRSEAGLWIRCSDSSRS